MYTEFSNKNVVVVGGTNGMGLDLVSRLISLNANVIVLGRNIDKPELEEFKPRCEFIKCDISNQDDVEKAFDSIASNYDVIHYAVNNAGVTAPYTEVANLDMGKWKSIIDTNLTGTAHCLQRQIKLISKNKNGAIVNVSSCAGLQALKLQAAYSVSKAAVNMLTQVASIECAEDGVDSYAVRINAVAPGPILGGMNTEENLLQNPERTKRKVSVTAMKRFGTATEVVNSILWLLGHQSSYITGIVLPVDGGFSSGKFN
ncbi:SDR family NAD(P)-dependent oxidoreductase [Serratia inhibens]|uniref:SDR family oxidoreductase n=1 Tax=Serratia inhibens TaxID=2338073 RepID=A0AA92X325_9GAMM|nr:SDR family oxidoreductase [Serratia inhibens]ANS41501.1 2,5-dichloro-2,5-cyclohexadiene-1,4-diol dehydrogenase [Serratia inhibens PRI-2C]RJF54796.1 SDR family oxidoreductase [Serratia inhibens]